MATIQDVAALAGVSVATVSRVTNLRGNVHPDTVRAVRQAIDKAKYQPPPPKPEKSHGQQAAAPTATISAFALIVPEITGGLYPSLLLGFEAAAREQYHQVIICNTNNDLYKQGNEILHLIHKRVGGVAMVPVASATTTKAHVEVLEASNIPVVLLHRDVEDVDAPLIALPLEAAGKLAGETLLERGHRRIAVFTSMLNASANMHVTGLRKAMASAGLELSDDLTCYCAAAAPLSWTKLEAEVDAGIERMWAKPPNERPTAIYVTYDTIAEVLFMRLMARGIRMPDDVSLIAFGSNQRTGAITSRLASVVVDELVIGRTAVDLLQRSRPRSGEDSQRRVCEADLAVAIGETLGPPSSR